MTKISDAVFHEILNAGFQAGLVKNLSGYLYEDANKAIQDLYKKYVEEGVTND